MRSLHQLQMARRLHVPAYPAAWLTGWYRYGCYCPGMYYGVPLACITASRLACAVLVEGCSTPNNVWKICTARSQAAWAAASSPKSRRILPQVIEAGGYLRMARPIRRFSDRQRPFISSAGCRHLPQVP
jgi:hypothetical protein